MSVLVQCAATYFLVLQGITTGSVVGVSARALMLDGLAIAFRLSCTVWLDGYLPVDASGDYLFQMIDFWFRELPKPAAADLEFSTVLPCIPPPPRNERTGYGDCDQAAFSYFWFRELPKPGLPRSVSFGGIFILLVLGTA